MNVAMPIIAAVIATTFELPLEVKVALIALAMSPVPPIIQKEQINAGGRREYVVGLLVAMSVLAVVLVPLTVVILDEAFGSSARVTPASVAKIMLLTVLAPLVVGLLIRHSVPTAEKASGPMIAVAGILLIVATVLLLYGLWPITRTYIGNGVVAMLAALATIGLAVGHLLGGPRAGDRTSLALSTASRHPAVALTIATSGTVSEPKPELAIILLYLIVATIISLPYQRWRKPTIGAAPYVEASH